MSRIAALGERHRVEGFALAGAWVAVADNTGEVERRWAELPEDVAVVILTPSAAAALAAIARPLPLRVVLPG